MRMTRAVLPAMRARRSGRIINMSSIGGFLPAPFSGYYASTKHALEGYSEALDHEVRRMGVRSSLIEPSFIASDVEANSWRCDSPVAAYDAVRNAFLARFADEIGKAPSTDVVARAVLKVIRAKNPPVRIPVGKGAKTLSRLRRFLPATIFGQIVRREYSLDKY